VCVCQVPFDEDQFTTSPNLENVTTLDKVNLDKDSHPRAGTAGTSSTAGNAIAAGIAVTAENAGAAGNAGNAAPKDSRAAALAAARGRAALPKRSNRLQANEQALGHFKGSWDVLWDAKKYVVAPRSAS